MGLICLWPPFFLIHTHVTIRFFSGLEKTFDKLFLVKEGECRIIATRGLILFSFLIPISFPPLLFFIQASHVIKNSRLKKILISFGQRPQNDRCPFEPEDSFSLLDLVAAIYSTSCCLVHSITTRYHLLKSIFGEANLFHHWVWFPRQISLSNNPKIMRLLRLFENNSKSLNFLLDHHSRHLVFRP